MSFRASAPAFVPRGGVLPPPPPRSASGGGAVLNGLAKEVADSPRVADGRGQLGMELSPEEVEIQAPLQAAITSITEGSSMEQESGAAALADLLREHGPILFAKPFLPQQMSVLAALKGALDSEGKAGGNTRSRLGALTAVRVLCESVGQWVEPYMISLLRHVLSCFKGARAVQAAAEEAARAVVAIMSPYAVKPLLDVLFDALKAFEWQVKDKSIILLSEVASSLRCKAQVAKALPEVILKLIECLQDTRPQVRQTTLTVFPEVCRVIENPDVVPLIPTLISAYANPDLTQTALEKLSATSFVNNVDAPTLGLMLPILMRGMKDRRVLSKRMCAVIIYNMCKLVVDPRDAAHFYPVLQPVMERAIDEVYNDEVKETCQKAMAKLAEVRGAIREHEHNKQERTTFLSNLRATVHNHSGLKMEALQPFDVLLDFTVALAFNMLDLGEVEGSTWSLMLTPYVSSFMRDDQADQAVNDFMEFCTHGIEIVADDEKSEEDVCNVEFSLAYGGKILLHNTRLWVKRGRRYGLMGQNGVGKTTLMRNIANGSLDGLPEGIRTVYVESNPASNLDTPVVEFVLADPKLPEGTSRKEVEDKLAEVGFSSEMQMAPLSSLSGGWRMKLSLAQAMLSHPDMLLLDEPTNHLDVNAVKWLTDYLRGLHSVTVLLVSHSSSFLDNVCTDILHYESQKLVHYPGTLSHFVQLHPEAKHYYELQSSTLKFNFPIPGRLEGINSRTQTFMRMENVTFTYPGAERPTLYNVSLRLCRASRVAVVGANGAGKSTLIKLLVGETTPDEGSGDVWKHHNLRMAYVAQHSFHHLEEHLDVSPVDYFKWRFANGVDKEVLEKETMQLTETEVAKLASDAYGAVEELRNRRTRHGKLEYEVKFKGMHERENKYLTKQQLEALGFSNLIKQADERVAAEAAGLDLRPLVTKTIQAHLDDFGLDQEFGTYGKISGLSGGQKVKLVLAAAMWNCPHLLVLDEPTNYLDREALGAFATAIKEYQGGVIMISHDREFMRALCTETWLVEGGFVDVIEEEEVEGKLIQRKREKKEDELSDGAKIMNAGSNINKAKEVKVEVDFWGKPLSKADIRKKQKEKARADKAAAKKGK